MRYFAAIWVSLRMSMYRALEFRSGVTIQYLTDALWYVLQFALLRTAYNYVPVIKDYSLAECYVFMAVLFTNDAVVMIFMNDLIEFYTRTIRTGALDFYLLKPMSTLYQIMFARVNLTGIFNVIFTVAFWVYTLKTFEVEYPRERWLWAAALFLNGCVLNFLIRLVISSFAFWTVEGGSLSWLFHELVRFGNKPEAVYGRPLRQVLISAVPVLLLSAWPCMVLIRDTTLWERLFPFAVSAVLSAALTVIWRMGLRRYEGLSFQA